MTRYVEVVGGAGWALFSREQDGAMEVFNDYNGDLINLYRCVREKTFALLRELNFLPLQSRDEFYLLRRFLAQEEFDDSLLRDDLEIAERVLSPPDYEEIRAMLLEQVKLYDVRRAAAFYKTIRCSYGSGGTSYSCQPFDIRRTFLQIRAAGRRLGGVVIEHKDFADLIRHYDRPGALFYCDPPYFEAECYAVEFPRSDHIRLRDTLANIEGRFLLSYNDQPFIRELYADFRIESITRLNNLAQRTEAGSQYPELLISNYDTTERARQYRQLSLFTGEAPPTAGLFV